MADEKNLDMDEDEFENKYRVNPYSHLPANTSRALENAPQKHVPRVKPIDIGHGNSFKEESEFSKTLRNIKTYIIKDVLEPTVKDVLYNIVNNSADMLIYHGEGRRRDRSYGSYYRRSSMRERDRDRDRDRDRGRSSIENKVTSERLSRCWDDIPLEKYWEDGSKKWTREKAEKVIRDLYDVCNDYPERGASVADLLDFIHVTARPTDENRGWYAGDLRGSCVRSDGDILWLCIPEPIPKRED